LASSQLTNAKKDMYSTSIEEIFSQASVQNGKASQGLEEQQKETIFQRTFHTKQARLHRRAQKNSSLTA